MIVAAFFVIRGRRPRRQLGDGRAKLLMQTNLIVKTDERAVPNTWSVSLEAGRLAYISVRGDYEVVVTEAFGAHYKRRGEKEVVILDNAPGKAYDEIFKSVAAACSWAVYYREPVFFSRDGSRYAYVARIDDRWFVVVDGLEDKGYERIRDGKVVFSPDGAKVAYVAEDGGKQFLVVNGREGRAYDSVDPWSLSFSGDGSHLVYRAARGAKECIVLDGTAGEPYDSVGYPAFSGDGLHTGYTALLGKAWVIIVDGRTYREVKSGWADFLALNADGSQVAYVVRSPNEEFVEVNGREGPRFAHVSPPIFTAEGKLLYRAATLQREFAPFCCVILGRTKRRCAGARELVVSRDGKHVAFVSRRGQSFAEVWLSKIARRPLFSERNDAEFVSVDLAEGPRFEEVRWPFFSADSRHIAYLAWKDGEWFAVVDGLRRQSVALPAEANPGHWHRVARGDGFVRVGVEKRDSREFHFVEIRLVPE